MCVYVGGNRVCGCDIRRFEIVPKVALSSLSRISSSHSSSLPLSLTGRPELDI